MLTGTYWYIKLLNYLVSWSINVLFFFIFLIRHIIISTIFWVCDLVSLDVYCKRNKSIRYIVREIMTLLSKNVYIAECFSIFLKDYPIILKKLNNGYHKKLTWWTGTSFLAIRVYLQISLTKEQIATRRELANLMVNCFVSTITWLNDVGNMHHPLYFCFYNLIITQLMPDLEEAQRYTSLPPLVQLK